MRIQKVLPKEYQFYLPDLDNIVLVKCESDGTVTVRATKGNCSEERKGAFIRRLAAEGFIPDEYQWLSDRVDESKGVRWIKDHSWLEISPAVTKRSNAFMKKLLIGAGLFWIAMIRVLLVSHPETSTAKATQKTARPPAIVSVLPAEGRGDSLVH
jgi:hypothetical protein